MSRSVQFGKWPGLADEERRRTRLRVPSIDPIYAEERETLQDRWGEEVAQLVAGVRAQQGRILAAEPVRHVAVLTHFGFVPAAESEPEPPPPKALEGIMSLSSWSKLDEDFHLFLARSRRRGRELGWPGIAIWNQALRCVGDTWRWYGGPDR